MKELDFDELDRAVNSLMTNVPKDADASDEESEKTLDITPMLSKDETPSFDAKGQPVLRPTTSVTVPTRDAVTSAPSPSTPPPAARRSGRFMDVVHPSSNIKKTAAIPAPVSRRGATIEPSSSFELPQTPASSVAALQTESKATISLEPASAERSAPKSDWPDPLDVANFNPSSDEQHSSEKKDETVTVPSIDTSQVDRAVDDKNELAPLVSPFLPDTKVEKRPLGSPSDPSESDHTSAFSRPPSDLMINNPSAQLPANPKDIEPILPAELHEDLVAVEADTSPAVVKEEVETIPVPPASSSALSSAPTSDMPSGPTSIAQQYREEPNTGDKDSGAIYDTDTYHQPLAHPAKKKSGWLWVLWIVLIIVVGAGIGAAAYYLHLF